MSEEERVSNPVEPTDLPQEVDATSPFPGEPDEELFALPAADAVGAEEFAHEESQAEPAEALEMPKPATGSKAATQPAAGVTDDDRLMAGLAWLSMAIIQLPVVSLVLLLAQGNKDRPFQRYHAVTSILFWGAALVYEILAAIAYTILTVVTLGCLGLILWVIFFLPHLAALYYAYQAYNGKEIEIPVISDFARKQGWA